MFTGIITSLGRLRSRHVSAVDGRLSIACPELDLGDVALGDSIAVNGICLTVTVLGDGWFAADISSETLQRSCLGDLPLGATLNLEKALAVNGRLGGHIVSGHVDGVGSIVERAVYGRAERFVVRAPAEIMRYIAQKGSIAIDGVSLTVNEVAEDSFALMLIPHTLANTIIPHYKIGRRVHLEVDIMARYAERLLQASRGGDAQPGNAGIAMSTLAKHGFL
jgi:riboflavin synthase